MDLCCFTDMRFLGLNIHNWPTAHWQHIQHTKLTYVHTDAQSIIA